MKNISVVGIGAAAILLLLAGVSIAFAALTFSGTSITGDSNSVIDATGTISIGTSTATGITIGRTGVTTTFPGTVAVTGGAVDGTVIGGTTPAAGAFTQVVSGAATTAAKAALPTGSHGFSCDESSTNGVPASNVDYLRCDSVSHTIVASENDGTETPVLLSGGPAGTPSSINLNNASGSPSLTQVTVTKPDSITAANCLAATTVSTPCLAYYNSWTGLGASGTTGYIQLYTTNAPAGATFLFCPDYTISTAASAGSILSTASFTTIGGVTYNNAWLSAPNANTTNLQDQPCEPITVGANSSLNFQVYAGNGITGSPVWEVQVSVLRMH
jgi:hypothetical protein